MWLRAQRNFARLGRMFLRKIGLLKLIADSFEDWRPWAAGDERAVITTWARQGGLQNDSGPTLGWNDMGPMQFGGLSSEEVRSEVLMWAMLKSPLFLGGKPENVPSEAIELLKNADLLKMNRGPGKQIEALMKRGSAEVWINRMEKGMRIGGCPAALPR